MSEPRRLRILFDGTEINETPAGWQDIVSTIKRVKEINSLFITTQAELTFMDDGYDYLITRFEDSFTNKVSIEMQEYCGGVYESFFSGTIFISSAVVDRKNCTIKVEVEDNSFYAKINNNKGLEVFPFAEQTKNSAANPDDAAYTISPCAYEKVQFFNPVDGVYLGVPVADYSGACYPVYNLFEYLISFMTDNSMGFESNLFGAGGDYEGLTVTCGIAIRQYYGGVGTTEADFKANFQKISFEKLFSEVNKKINIGMIVDYSSPQPKIKIERVSDLRSSATSFQATNIDELRESIDAEQLFASVRLGSTTISEKNYVSFPEEISFVGFKEEQFIVLGESNIDKELNLVSDWIISSDVIEDMFVHGASEYDDKLVFVMCDISGGNYQARQTNLERQTGGLPIFYNLDLNGEACMENYFGAVPLSIAQYLGNNNDTFKAHRSTDLAPVFATYTNIQCQTEDYDVNGNYSTVNGRYTLPLSGLYTFELYIRQWYTLINSIGYGTGYYIEHWDSAFVTLIERRLMGSIPGDAGLSTATYSGVFSGVAGDIFIATFDAGLIANTTIVLTDSYFACTNAVDGGGEYKTFDPADYPVYLHQWEYPLTLAEYKNIVQNQTAQIQFSRYGEKNYSGWIDSVKFKRFSDEKAQFVTYRAKSIPVTSNIPPEIRKIHMIGQLGDEAFDLTPDLYGNPWGGSDITNKIYFFFAESNLTMTVPATYLGCDFLYYYITRFTQSGGVSTTQLFSTTSSFLVESQCDYIVQITYDLTQLGNTWPSVLPEITAPVTAGTNGSANIRLVNPTVLADYTFLWSTGATTQNINAPAGDYTCTVTYVPGTFDNNIIIFNIQIPVSQTGQ